MVKALAAFTAKSELKEYEFKLGDLGDNEVEVKVEYCGICHSDISVLDNDWGNAKYPFVPGHEVAGKVIAVGKNVKSHKIGDRVGIGWYSESCMTCSECMSGSHNLCSTAQGVMMGRHGGFSDKVRCHFAWAIKLPDALSDSVVGPLMCGGITVFTPMLQCNVLPTERVGVIGVGGLGHMAIKFLKAWGCEVTAFSSTPSKEAQLRALGAHNVVNSRDPKAISEIRGSLDFIISTVNVPLSWDAYVSALAPRGRLHFVGAVLEPIPVGAFPLIVGAKSISGSPVGKPTDMDKMLEFCARHSIEPQVEVFPMSKANEAIAKVRDGKVRYRAVLKNDL